MSHTHDHDHHHEHSPSRRSLLKAGMATVAGQAAIPFALNLASMGAAAAQSSSNNDYKALVCLFLHGGNDHANSVIATSGDSWNNYERLRPDIGLSSEQTRRNFGDLLAISPANLNEFGNTALDLALHPALGNTRTLFQAGQAAIISNVGPLIEPTTPEEYQRSQTRIPRRLFSHNDQQSTWQTFSPEGSQVGWGGRLVDRFASSFNASASFIASVAPGNNPAAWLTGQRTNAYAIPISGRIGIQAATNNLGGIPNGGQPLRDLLMLDRSNAGLLERTVAQLNERTLAYQQTLQEKLVAEDHAGLMAAVNFPDTNAVNPLTQQIRMIARIIASRNNLGVRRQVFFIQMGGFDMHNDLLHTHNRLLRRIDQAIGFFAEQMKAIGVENQVTLFTASDFGRSMISNGNGSDHGWGAHHFVVGGAVNGGRIYGKFPTFGVNAGNDVNGRLVPGYSVEQYAAGLGEWFGLSRSELLEALPNLINFGSSVPRFMKA